MQTILSPITSVFTVIFEAIHKIVAGTNVFSVGAGYVMAVFLLTLLVRILVLPLNIKQMKAQAKMQEVQPEIAKLQKKYKNNPEKANQEVMKLYQQYKINPMSGCLPLIIQMPILFALYYVFMDLTPLRDVSFLWLSDLSGQDKLYILPMISAITTYLSSYLMSKSMGNGENQPGGMNMSTMNIVMAGMMGFMSINFPSMLVLYWIIGNLIQMLQTYVLVVLPKKKKEIQPLRAFLSSFELCQGPGREAGKQMCNHHKAGRKQQWGQNPPIQLSYKTILLTTLAP